MTSPQDAARVFYPELSSAGVEMVCVAIMNVKNEVLHLSTVSKGSSIETLMPIREIMALCLRHDGLRLIVAHNHPSGSLDPSVEDLNITKRLHSAADVIGLKLLDHMIIAGQNFHSLKSTHPELWNE
jgi:DNA repair protein RadC